MSLFPYFSNAFLYTFITTIAWAETKNYYKTSVLYSAGKTLIYFRTFT